MAAASAALAFELADAATADAVCDAVQVIHSATSLGSGQPCARAAQRLDDRQLLRCLDPLGHHQQPEGSRRGDEDPGERLPTAGLLGPVFARVARSAAEAPQDGRTRHR